MVLLFYLMKVLILLDIVKEMVIYNTCLFNFISHTYLYFYFFNEMCMKETKEMRIETKPKRKKRKVEAKPKRNEESKQNLARVVFGPKVVDEV